MMGRKFIWAFISIVLVIGTPQTIIFADTTIVNENCKVSEILNGDCSSSNENKKEIETKQNNGEVLPANGDLEKPNTFLILAQMLSALVLVIILIYALLRFINKRSTPFRSNQIMQNIGGVPLGANRSVQMVKIGDRFLVVGVGESIQLLKEIDDKAEIEQIMNLRQDQLDSFDQPINKMMDWFMKRLRLRKNNVSKASRKKNSDEFKNLLTKQLTDVSTSQKKLHDVIRERDK